MKRWVNIGLIMIARIFVILTFQIVKETIEKDASRAKGRVKRRSTQNIEEALYCILSRRFLTAKSDLKGFEWAWIGERDGSGRTGRESGVEGTAGQWCGEEGKCQ